MTARPGSTRTTKVYRTGAQVSSFGIASLISWRGTWYVMHLGAALRHGSAVSSTSPPPDPALPDRPAAAHVEQHLWAYAARCRMRRLFEQRLPSRDQAASLRQPTQATAATSTRNGGTRPHEIVVRIGIGGLKYST